MHEFPGDDEDNALSHLKGSAVEQAHRKMMDAVLNHRPAKDFTRQYELMAQVHDVGCMVAAYMQAVSEDKAGPKNYRDFPGFSAKKKNRLKRRGGFIDQAHNAEHLTGDKMRALLAAIDAPAYHITNEQRRELRNAFRGLAEAMDDLGIYLDQGKNFANKRALPAEHQDYKTSEPWGHKALFTRLNDEPRER